MSYDAMLSGLNKQVAAFVGHLSTAEKHIDRMADTASGKLRRGLSGLTDGASARWSERQGSRGNLLSGSLGSFGSQDNRGASGEAGQRNSTFPTFSHASGGSGEQPRSGQYSTASGRMNPTFGGTGGGSGSAGGSGGGGGGAAPAGGGGGFSGKLAIAAGAAAAAWQGTPGLRDAQANQASLFPVAFAESGTGGSYNNKRVNQRILDAVNNGASSPFAPTAAAAAMTYSGYTMNMGNTADQMLTTAGFMYQMTGMNNIASVQGSMALTQGSTGISDKLLGVGINTVTSSGNPKDLGAIIDQLWNRWYGGKKVTEEQLDRDIAMGFVGADLNELFGGQPALYAQAVQLLRLKVKEGGRSGIRLGLKSGPNSAVEVAKKYGLDEYNSPMASAGDVNTSQGKLLMEASEGLLSGGVGANNVEQAAASAASALIEFTGPLGDATMALKGFTQGIQTSSTAGPAASFLAGIVKSFLFAGGGLVDGAGGSTSDSVSARLSKGEFVINSRAAQKIGLKNLRSLNALGHDFGSGFASPSKAFNKGGEVNGSDVVDLASQYVGTPYVDSATLKGGQSSASPENGWDCSTFTHWVYKQFGVNLPMYSDSYLGVGTPVSRDELQPGDLLLWKTNSEKETGHVSIYAGNGEHVHAANPDAGTVRAKISQWYWDRFHSARRVSSSTLSQPTGPGVNASGSDAGAPETGRPALLPQGQIGGSVEYANSYSTSQGLSLSSLGTSGGSVGSFGSTGQLDAGGVAGNSGILTRSLASIFDGVGAGGAKVDDERSGVGTSGGTEVESRSSDTTRPPKGALSQWLSAAGFKGVHHREAWAIAMRESGGNPRAYNGSGPDDSYGLFQINFKVPNPQQRHEALLKNVQGYQDRDDLFDPMVNARAAAYMSQKGKNWSSWVSPTYGKAAEYYDAYAQSASVGLERVSKDGVYNLHAGEAVVPASLANDFREALRDALGGGSSQPVTINLKINKASDEEAERFARKVMGILSQGRKMERLRTS